ncbi:hypothetical protein C8R44DRAFT_738900 [Mycena epipterygia]|nr:hypothetical protein C8R44DRAFT_738900 [Mycena epipterygia]
MAESFVSSYLELWTDRSSAADDVTDLYCDLFADLLPRPITTPSGPCTTTLLTLFHAVSSSPQTRTVASTAPSPPGASTAAGPSSSTLAPPTASASASASASPSGASTSSAQTHAAARLANNAGAAISYPLIHQPPLPASNPTPEQGVLPHVSADIIPFAGVIAGVPAWHKTEVEGRKSRDPSSRMRTWTGPNHPQGLAQLEEYEKGENSPEVLRCLSEWISILDEGGTVPDTKLSSLLRGIHMFEITLETFHVDPPTSSLGLRFPMLIITFKDLGRNLHDATTLPCCVVVPVNAPAAARERLWVAYCPATHNICYTENHTGYDDNDLDFDMFCRETIHQDLQSLKKVHVWSSSPYRRTHRALAFCFVPRIQSTSNAGSMHECGGNMFRASLASLLDTASLQEESETETEENVKFYCRTSSLNSGYKTGGTFAQLPALGYHQLSNSESLFDSSETLSDSY